MVIFSVTSPPRDGRPFCFLSFSEIIITIIIIIITNVIKVRQRCNLPPQPPDFNIQIHLSTIFQSFKFPSSRRGGAGGGGERSAGIYFKSIELDPADYYITASTRISGICAECGLSGDEIIINNMIEFNQIN